MRSVWSNAGTPLPVNDLLYRVEVCAHSGPAREELKDVLREALAELGFGQPAAVLGPEEVRACYLGNASKTKFYDLLKTDPELKALSFVLGQRRLWRRADLDQWIEDYKKRQSKSEQPKVRQGADQMVAQAELQKARDAADQVSQKNLDASTRLEPSEAGDAW